MDIFTIIFVIGIFFLSWELTGKNKQIASLVQQTDLLRTWHVNGILYTRQIVTTTKDSVALWKIPSIEGERLLELSPENLLVLFGREEHRNWLNVGLMQNNKLITGWLRQTEIGNIFQNGQEVSIAAVPISQYEWNTRTDLLHLRTELIQQSNSINKNSIFRSTTFSFSITLTMILAIIFCVCGLLGLFMGTDFLLWSMLLLVVGVIFVALLYYWDIRRLDSAHKQFLKVNQVITNQFFLGHRLIWLPIQGSNTGLPEDIAALLPDFKINAIQEYKARAGVSLKEAKRVIDEYQANLKRQEAATESK